MECGDSRRFGSMRLGLSLRSGDLDVIRSRMESGEDRRTPRARPRESTESTFRFPLSPIRVLFTDR